MPLACKNTLRYALACKAGEGILKEVNTLWGIDLGGTKIEAVVLPEGSIEPLCRVRIPTEADQGYEHIVGRLETVLKLAAEQSGNDWPKAVGLGMPGSLDPDTGLVRNANTTCLIGKPLIENLNARLQTNVIAANDANCFALAEANFGAGREGDFVFGVIMGTGVGGGIVIKKQVWNGRMLNAGEWGHNILECGGYDCYCGKKGCIETVLAGPWVERWHKDQTGEAIRLAAIAERAEAGDPACERTMQRLIDRFGEAISTLINIMDPDVIVLGGGVGNVSRLYTEGVEAVAKYVFNDKLLTKIVSPELGDSAGVFGAALLTVQA